MLQPTRSMDSQIRSMGPASYAIQREFFFQNYTRRNFKGFRPRRPHFRPHADPGLGLTSESWFEVGLQPVFGD